MRNIAASSRSRPGARKSHNVRNLPRGTGFVFILVIPLTEEQGCGCGHARLKLQACSALDFVSLNKFCVLLRYVSSSNTPIRLLYL